LIAKLATHCQAAVHATGDFLAHEGEVSNGVIFILAGSATACRHRDSKVADAVPPDRQTSRSQLLNVLPGFHSPSFSSLSSHLHASHLHAPSFHAPHFHTPHFHTPHFQTPHFSAARFHAPRMHAPTWTGLSGHLHRGSRSTVHRTRTAQQGVHLGPGSVFGELGLFASKPPRRAADVQVSEGPLEAVFLPRDGLDVAAARAGDQVLAQLASIREAVDNGDFSVLGLACSKCSLCHAPQARCGVKRPVRQRSGALSHRQSLLLRPARADRERAEIISLGEVR